MKPTPSMAVASVALLVSLSGIGTAAYTALVPKNSVSTAAIIDGSIRLKDIHPIATRALQGRSGARGPAGPTGPAGPPGPAGQNGLDGGFDPSTVQVVQGAEANVPPNEVVTAQAECLSGTKLIGGGAFTSAESLWLSRPSGNSWVAGATGFQYVSGSLRAYAICAAP